jgi:hypothetical protein
LGRLKSDAKKMTKMDTTYLFIGLVVSKFLFRKKREYECPYKHEYIAFFIRITQIHFDGHPPRTCALLRVKLPSIGMHVTLTYKFSTTKFFRTTA